MIYQDQGFSF